MTLAAMMDQQGTILRAELTEDRNHNEVEDWSTPTETPTAYMLGPVSTSEQIDGRDALIGVQLLYLPPDADVTGRDRFRDAAGDVYLITGPIVQARRPRRGVHHLEANLKLVEG